MTERHILLALLVLSGAGVGALVAHFMGVTSWTDARVFLAIGAAAGLGASALLKR
jgi:hypothetical protein